MKVILHFLQVFIVLFLYTFSIAVVDAESLRYQMVAASPEIYAEPHDLVLSPDGKQLYVADNGNDRVAVLDPMTLALLGEFGKSELSQPHDVAFDPLGRLLVADTGNDRIAIYQIEGLKGRLVGALKQGLRRPEGVAARADGRILATGAASNNLVVYRDGEVIVQVGGFSAPHDVAFDAGGGIWVADAGNDRMVRLNNALQATLELSGPPYHFDGPRYLDFDSEGRMYVADKYSHRIKIIAPGGQLLQVIGEGKAGKGPGRFDRPEGVAIRGQDIWFSDTYNGRIVRYQVIEGKE